MRLVAIRPARRNNLAVLQAHFDGSRRCVKALLFGSFQRPIAGAADDRLPVDTFDEFIDLARGHAGRIAAADQRAHAGAGDAIDRDPHFLQDLEHPHVCPAAGTAAGERETDSGPMGGRAGCRGVLRNRCG